MTVCVEAIGFHNRIELVEAQVANILETDILIIALALTP
jgi:hypothetical protein